MSLLSGDQWGSLFDRPSIVNCCGVPPFDGTTYICEVFVLPGRSTFCTVNATTLPNGQLIKEDGTFSPGTDGFQPLMPPQLELTISGGNELISWLNPVPGFVLQETSTPGSGATWTDVANPVYIVGPSNVVTVSFPSGVPARFYRTRQR